MRLPAETIAALDQRAAAEGINRSELLRRMIEAGLKRRSKP
jgi:predicted DNA binding CopG/RHH family protein